MKPNLFIVGAPKAGTTAIFDAFRSSGKMFLPAVKELNFFSREDLERHGSYYQDFRVGDMGAYLKLFNSRQAFPYRVDASTSYFTYPKTAQRIKEFNPDSKIIILLRDPIERAYSHYQMDKRMGLAPLSLEEYIGNKQDHPAHFRQYVTNSCFHEHCRRFLSLFGEEAVYFLRVGKMKEDLPGLFKFLDLDQVPEAAGRRRNEFKVPKNAIAQALTSNRRLVSNLKKWVPQMVIDLINPHLYKRQSYRPMSPSERELLLHEVAPDFRELKELLRHMELNHWLTYKLLNNKPEST